MVYVDGVQLSNNSNSYSRMVYDGTASIFSDTYHLFLPSQSDVISIDDEPPIHIDEDSNLHCR